ncbi:MAG TPA: FecR family protein [Bryobacteraceae bacterium]|nr:FecR family protein [Bryobacteraceae bacterium]
MKRIALSIAAIAALIAGSVVAQDPQGPGPNDPQQQEPDGQYEQGRGVARISILSGEVSVRRADSGDVVAAAVNGPLMAGDSILTSSSSKAEVQLDASNLIRVGPNSEVRFSGLDVRGFQIQVAAGTVMYRVLRQGQAQSEIDTPSVAVHPLGQGAYRIGLRGDGTSEITVRQGEAEIFSQHGSERLAMGHTMYARGPAADPEFQVVNAIPQDNWDRWNFERDQYLLRTRSYDHVSRDIPGVEDLDQNGRWTNDPSYGAVWQPNVDPGWAPYQNGRWVWEDYYGWTWVSADPWGWAPYHYGRWFFGAGGWCWYPGPIFAHPYWAPAYVGFFGWGGGIGIGFGFGGLGWVPLAPFEVFHPWYGRGFYAGFRGGGFARGTTIVNNINIANTYRNARVPGGVSGTAANQFGRNGAQITSLSHSQIQSAGLVHGAVPVAPGRSSLQMSNRTPNGNFAQSRATTFASHMQAPAVSHVSFANQQRGMQQLSHSDFSAPSRSLSRGGLGNPGVQSARPSLGGNSTGSAGGHGWNRFGEPIHAGSAMSGTMTGGGWQRSETTRPSYGTSTGTSTGRAVRISPPIVQQRSYSSPGYQAPRNSTTNNSGSSRSYSNPGPSRSSGGSTGTSHASGGGGGHASGGGGGHGGGGHR